MATSKEEMDCIVYLQQQGSLPLFNNSVSSTISSSQQATTDSPNGISSSSISPSSTYVMLSSSVPPQKSKYDTCKELLFGNLPGNGSLPYHLLVAYGATLPPTTTTTPGTTIKTTVSQQELERRLCESFRNHSFTFSTCINPCHKCYIDNLILLNEYLACRQKNLERPSMKIENEPMLLTLLINKFGAQINKYELDWRCPTPPSIFHSTKMVFDIGKKFRYGDKRLPDYNIRPFTKTNKRWLGRNDTIEIPYGNIPRGWYTFEFVMYEHIIDKKIPKEKLRLKHAWTYRHPIITGAYIEPRTETGLYDNENLQLNSMIISLELSPARKNPLPGENIISFTHLRTGLEKPICVYWQPLETGRSSVLTSTGYWTNYGMRVFKTNKSMTVCRSYHLSAFAVLMEPETAASSIKPDPLNPIIVFLTVVSILMLTVYIIAMLLLKCVRTIYSRMYLYIAVSCLLAQIFFLVGFNGRKSWSSCTTMVTWMQFCHTSVFSWLLLEGVHHLSRLRYIFNEKTNANAFYLILGIGFPIAVAIALQEYPYQHFDELRYCWVYTEGYDLLFFAGPLVVLLLVSLALRFMIFMELRKCPGEIATNVNYDRAYHSLIASVVIIPTYTVLLCFGTFAVKGNKTTTGVAMVTLPLFYICISFEIFYLYFYRNDEVIDAVVTELQIREKTKLKTYSYLKGLNMRAKYQHHNDDEKEEYEEEEKQDEWSPDLNDDDLKDSKLNYTSV